MKKRILIAIGMAIASVASVLALTTGPASASPPGDCSVSMGWSAWYNGGTNWGQMRFCYDFDYATNEVYWRFQVDDTLTDGYAVHLEACINTPQCNGPYFYDNVAGGDPTWVGCTQSVGPVSTSLWPGFTSAWHAYYPLISRVSVRVVKGRCNPGGVDHQDVAHFDIYMSD